MLIIFGYLLLAALLLLLIWGLCIEARQTARDLKHWGGKKP